MQKSIVRSPIRRGFTLIELLVVIAIIAILAAILFPVFAKAREKARQTSCLSNEKQVALGILQYIQDYNECFPGGLAVMTTSGQPTFVGWAGATQPYVKNGGVFKCPDDSTAAVGAYTADSYALNSNLAGIGGAQGGAGLGSLNSPAKTVLLCEVNGAAVDVTDATEGTNGYTVAPASPTQTMSCATEGVSDQDPNAASREGLFCMITGVPSTYVTTNKGASVKSTGVVKFETGIMGSRTTVVENDEDQQFGYHSGGSNFALCDGHAKWLMGSSVSTGRNATNSVCLQGAPTGETGTMDFSCLPPFGGQIARDAAGTGDSHWNATFSAI